MKRHCRQLYRWPGPVIPAASLVLMLVGLLAIAPVAGAFQDTGAEVTGVTDPTIRVINASSGAADISILIDGAPVVENVAFGDASEYVRVRPGEHQVQVVSGGGDPVIDQTESFAGEAAYLLGVVGPMDDLQLQVSEVDLEPLEPGQARVRVFHAAPDAGGVDISLAGQPDALVGDISFPDASDYQTVTVGTYNIVVRSVDSGAALTTAPDVMLAEGRAYDVFAIGEAGTQSVNLLSLFTSVSVPCSDLFGLGQPSGMCLRIVHAVPDAGAVDLYVGEMMVAENLEFGDITEFAAAPSGNQQLRVVAAGGSLDEPAVDTTSDFISGRAYQAVITGLSETGIEATISTLDTLPLPADQARVRVVHAAPDAGSVDVAVVGGGVPFEGIDFRTESGYVAFNAGSYGFQLRLSGDETVLVETPDVDLEPGMLYDILALGQSEAGTLELVMISAMAETQQGDAAMATSMATPEPLAAAKATPVIAAGATPGADMPAATPDDTE